MPDVADLFPVLAFGNSLIRSKTFMAVNLKGLIIFAGTFEDVNEVLTKVWPETVIINMAEDDFDELRSRLALLTAEPASPHVN